MAGAVDTRWTRITGDSTSTSVVGAGGIDKTATVPAHPVRLIVDCDPGVDDALALLYLAGHPEVTIEAVGSVHGNVPAALAARNALRILEVAGLEHVPVAIGAARPMAQPLATAEFVHGADGLGDTAQPEPRGHPSRESAAEQLVRLARAQPGELSLLAIGPLTNVGLALLIEPELPNLLRQVVVMGGAFHVAGNVSALAEANFANDPEAAQLVLSAGWPLRAVGLDVTHQTLLRRAQLARLEKGGTDVARFAWAVLQFYLDVYERRVGERACPVHDGLAAVLLVDPGLATWERDVVDVELRGELTRGAAVVDRRWGEEASTRVPVDVAVGVDHGTAVARLLDALGV
jgi:purine nucleosidase